ncbi:hypothetical protein GCM10023310_19920 [Paenibacillus vulneris]|uniref:DDE domain-containing protein n=1 Tax=Paenibacillus vulneris TaxID=1133364 RepID=A0ABW3UN77_9BACL|nr:hypothetical protein [Paenibacillus sp. 32352]
MRNTLRNDVERDHSPITKCLLRNTELEYRAKTVKGYEVSCYQMCFYLLQNEAKAMKAALASVEALLLNDSFFSMPERERLDAVRKVSIRCSLRLV